MHTRKTRRSIDEKRAAAVDVDIRSRAVNHGRRRCFLNRQTGHEDVQRSVAIHVSPDDGSSLKISFGEIDSLVHRINLRGGIRDRCDAALYESVKGGVQIAVLQLACQEHIVVTISIEITRGQGSEADRRHTDHADNLPLCSYRKHQ